MAACIVGISILATQNSATNYHIYWFKRNPKLLPNPHLKQKDVRVVMLGSDTG